MKRLCILLSVIVFLNMAMFSSELKIPVKVVPVIVSDISDTVSTIGSIRAKNQLVFSTKVMGKITSFTSEEGDYINKGKTIVKIDSSDLQAKLNLLSAQKKEIAANISALNSQVNGINVNLKNAKKDLNRQVSLLKRGSTTQKNVDDIKTKYDSLVANKNTILAKIKSVREKSKQITARKEEIYSLLKYTEFITPFAGYITKKYNYQGELAKPGMSILKYVCLDEVKAQLIVNEIDIKKIKKGQKIKFIADALNNIKFETSVYRIIPEGNDVNRSFKIYGVIKNDAEKSLKPGMFIRGDIVIDTHNSTLLVSKDAIMQNEGKYYLFKAKDGIALKSYVKVGYENDKYIEILSGISKEDKIIVIGKENLSDKSSIRIIK